MTMTELDASTFSSSADTLSLDPAPAARYNRIGALVIDRWGHDVRLEGRSVTLTAKEFALLTFLFEHRGRALSREQLLGAIWGPNYHGGRRTVDVHVRRLRAKLREYLPLDTLRGVGYRLSVADPAID